MKLRIHEDSIRLRLTQSEVSGLAAGREVSQSTPTAPSPLLTVLQPDTTASGIAASHDAGRLTITIPQSLLSGWDTDSRVGFDSTHGPLRILIEKDFQCAHPADPSENKDCFPNPNLPG